MDSITIKNINDAKSYIIKLIDENKYLKDKIDLAHSEIDELYSHIDEIEETNKNTKEIAEDEINTAYKEIEQLKKELNNANYLIYSLETDVKLIKSLISENLLTNIKLLKSKK